jgi:hypothetical protein
MGTAWVLAFIVVTVWYWIRLDFFLLFFFLF